MNLNVRSEQSHDKSSGRRGIDVLETMRSGLAVALRWGAGSLVAGGLLVLPSPPPIPPAQALQNAIGTVVGTVDKAVLPTPSVPVPIHVSPPPVTGAVASPPPGAGAQNGGAAAQPVHRSSAPPSRGLAIPFTSIVVAASPLDIALIGALVTLPLLLGIWLLLFGRTVREAGRAREAHFRLTLAAELGLKPRELVGMSVKTLFGLREKAAFDELTGVLRRAAGISAAEREIGRARRNGTPLAVAFVDVDGLKAANDKRGHVAGDRLLRELVRELKAGLRSQDTIFRYGGDEFVCVLPDTDRKGARTKLGSIQQSAARLGIRFSSGVAEMRRSDDVVALFARADAELYDFKANRGEIVELTSIGSAKRRRRRGVTA
jgi:diguanylate cyclase (GGDEF)-like protein